MGEGVRTPGDTRRQDNSGKQLEHELYRAGSHAAGNRLPGRRGQPSGSRLSFRSAWGSSSP